jgi:hypothetical protein
VESPAQWPGVHCVRPLLAGDSAVEGLWFDRTREHCARLRGESFERRKFTQTEKVELSQLPCWKNLPPEAYRERIADLVQVIEQQARERREATGLAPLGVKAILTQKPFDRPKKPKKSPAPLFHAFTKATRKALWEAYGWFGAAFQEAAEKLRSGNRDARFPTGIFPPRLPSSQPRPADLMRPPGGQQQEITRQNKRRFGDQRGPPSSLRSASCGWAELGRKRR